MRRSDSRLLLSLLLTAGFLSGGVPLPLAEPPPPGPAELRDFMMTEDRPGSAREPGSFSFSFTLYDANGLLYPLLSRKNITLRAGSKKISQFLLTPAAGRYEILVPRLPLQERNGRYDLKILIEENGTRCEELRQKALLYSQNPIDVLLIVDTSTSMRLNDPDGQRRKAIESVLRTARREGIVSRLSIVKFSSKAQLLCGFTDVSRRDVFAKALEGIDSFGETAIGAGLQTGLDEILKNRGPNRIIAILLTDGENNGPWKEEHHGYRKEGVPLHTIGMTRSVDNRFLDRISREAGGEYFEAPDGFSLTAIYQRIVQTEANRKILVERAAVLPPGGSISWDLSADASFRRIRAVVSSEHPLTLEPPPGSDSLFADPSSGFWSFAASPAGTKPDTTVRIRNTSRKTNRVDLAGFIRSGLNISFPVKKKVYYANEPVPLSCLAFQDDQPLTGCRITGKIAGNSSEVFRLADNGLHNDGDAEDGFYRTYLPPLPAGHHEILLSAEGEDLLGRPFRKNARMKILVLGESTRKLSFKSSAMAFSSTGKSVDHFRSFEAFQSGKSGLTVRVTPLPLSVETSAGDKILLPVHTSPAATALEPGRAKLFNISMSFPDSVRNGTYTSAIIVESEDESLYIPFQVAFDRYRIMDSGDKK